MEYFVSATEQKKSNGDCDFLFHNCDFFSSNSEFTSRNFDFLKNQNSEFTSHYFAALFNPWNKSHNSDFFVTSLSWYLTILTLFLNIVNKKMSELSYLDLIVRKKVRIWDKTLQLKNFIFCDGNGRPYKPQVLNPAT